jgi:hypothetical protein
MAANSLTISISSFWRLAVEPYKKSSFLYVHVLHAELTSLSLQLGGPMYQRELKGKIANS